MESNKLHIMFTVYSKVGCDYCVAVEKLLTINKVPFEKKLLNVDFTRDEFIEKFGVTSFPRVLDPNGGLIGGAKETAVYLKRMDLL
jgi:glutaredoxin